jgi:hypothetical protein
MMKTDLDEQIHDLMERGLRPVTIADIRNRAPVRVTRLQRAAARSPLGDGRPILAGAAVVAVCVAVAIAALLFTRAGHGSGTARLAAWAVTRQSDGSVMVVLRELPNPAKLQQKLRADGIPARVVARRAKKIGPKEYLMPDSRDVPGCHIYLPGLPGFPSSLWQKIFYGPHTNVRSYNFWIYPKAIPPGRGVVIFIDVGPIKLSNTDQRPGADLGYGVDGYSLELADASPQCTSS